MSDCYEFGLDGEMVRIQGAGRPTPGGAAALAELLRAIKAKGYTTTEPRAICGVVSQSGPNGEPLACGYVLGHDGPHAWSTLPTFPVAEPVEEAPKPEDDGKPIQRVCNYHGTERGAYCDLTTGHSGRHYFARPRSEHGAEPVVGES